MNLFELAAKIVLNTSEYEKGLSDASQKTSSFASKLKTGLTAAAKVAATAVTAAAAAVTAITKQSVESFAEYEQLVGGAKLVFGDAYDFIAEKAQSAFSTVQLSQNDYLRQVNGLAVGLKTALGGNEQAAAQLADKIITAEADIVAAMGITQESAQNAFNGIMKGNYQMLDNLMLGITPTKAGMQEVIDKVNEWNAATGEATNYQITNLADCQSALVDYVKMQGLAGYAANEAFTTIQGSFAAMKAAWQNVLTGMASGTADMNGLIQGLVTTASNFAGNIMPVISNAIAGIGQLVTGLAPVLSEQLPAMLNTALPAVVDGAMALLNGISAALPAVAEAIVGVVPIIVDGLLSALPTIASAAVSIVTALASGLASALPALIPAAAEAAIAIAQGLISNIPSIISAGMELILGLVQGLMQAIPTIIAALPGIITGIVDGLLTGIPMIIETGIKLLIALVEGLPQIISTICAVLPEIITNIITTLASHAPDIAMAGVDLLVALIENLPTIISTIIGAIPQIVQAIVMTFITHDPEMKQAGLEMMIRFITGFVEKASELYAKAKEIINSAKNQLVSIAKGFTAVGSGIVSGILSGLSQGWGRLTSWVTERAHALLEAAKSALGIASPSKKFRDEVGAMMARGIGVGFVYQMPEEIKRIRKALDFDVDISRPRSMLQGETDTVGGRSVTIIQNIYSEAKTAADLMREARWEQERAVITGV